MDLPQLHQTMIIHNNLRLFLAEGMLNSKECFKDGRVNKDALKGFIKDIKKNTKLSDEDAAVIAASKVRTLL